ncbi:MAG: hypothetical protein IKJ65_03805 [Clostridia bacterium]|nr:hypothetical protein [Clostridia bacterium]
MKINDFHLLFHKKFQITVQTIWKFIKIFIGFIPTIPRHLIILHKKAIILFGKLKYNIPAFISWCVRTYRNRYGIAFDCFFHLIKAVILLIVTLGSFLFILISSELILLSESHFPYLNQQFSTKYITESGVLGSQITFVLICVSLIALISNIDQKYIYGEKLIHLAFTKYGISSFRTSMIIMFSLLVINIILMFQKKPFAAVIIVYLITMYLALFILYRFSSVFLNSYAVKKKLLRRYYRCNITHMKKEKPSVHHTSFPLISLKNITIKYIFENNFAALCDNMVLYFSLLKYTLCNHVKLSQEYHTETNSGGDIIGQINEIALTMLKHGNALFALQTYVALLKKLNYYKITIVTDMYLSSAPGLFTEALTSCNNKTQISQYLYLLLEMDAELVEQTYLFATVDLSYCRLSKHQLLHSYITSDMYGSTYDQLLKISYLSKEDRNELINSIRLNIVSLYTFEQLRENRDCHITWKRLPVFSRNYPFNIRSEPVAHYMLRLIETSNAEQLWRFSFLFQNNSKDYRDEVYAKILSILSVLTMLYHENKRVYEFDLNIDADSVKQLFKDLNYLDCSLSISQAKQYYDYTIQHYIKDKSPSFSMPLGTYPFSRFFDFDKIVVDTVFACLIWKNYPEDSLDTITSEFNLQFDKQIYNIMKELGLSHPETL